MDSILLFVLIAIFGNLLFNLFGRDERPMLPDARKYLPPGYVIGIIWVLLFGLLGFIYKKADFKIIIILFLFFCLLYGPITAGKSPRFIKNYNYLTLLFLVIVSGVNYRQFVYFIPFYAWIGYINYVTYMDDIGRIDIF